MPILALDTSAVISVAVLDGDGRVLTERLIEEQRQQAELLTPTIQVVLAEAGFVASDLTAIAVGTGPGPFTGLRIGLATAESLGFALGVPVYGVCSLDALAAEANDLRGLRDGSQIMATLDARRKEVYWARYRLNQGSLSRVEGPQVSRPEAMEVIPTFEVCGFLSGGLPRYPSAVWVGRLALGRAGEGLEQPTTPLYLRRPDIQGQAPQAL